MARRGIRAALVAVLTTASGLSASPHATAGTQAPPFVSSEFPGPDPVISSAYALQTDPGVAWGTTSYLVVWEDERNGDGNADIYGARVAVDGTVLDMGGIPISTAPGFQYQPDVAFDGADFLVVWNSDGDVLGARVSQSGEVIESGISIAVENDDQEKPTVAWSGQTYFVAWQDKRGGATFDLYGARVAADGTVLDEHGLLLFETTDLFAQYGSQIAWGGSNYLLTWSYGHSHDEYILAERLDANGSVLDATPLRITADGGADGGPEVAAGGGLFIVVFGRTGFPAHMFGVRVDADGAILDDPGVDIAEGGDPVVGWDGAQFLVAWPGSTLKAARVSLDGQVLDEPIEVSSNIQTSPVVTVAGNGSAGLIAWGEDVYDFASDVDAARVAQDGTVLDPDGFLVSSEVAAATVTDPAVAWNGSMYLMAWGDSRFGYQAVFAGRFTAQGEGLDGAGIPIGIDGNDRNPAVASDGTNFLVARQHEDPGYTGGSEVWGVRIDPDGQILDADPIPIRDIGGNDVSPALSFDGANYLATWVHHDRISEENILEARRVAPDGSLLEKPITLASSLNELTVPVVASNGSEWLVVWRQEFRSEVITTDIYGMRVSADGQIIDGVRIPVSDEPADQTLPAVAWDGTNFVVAWQDSRSGVDDDVYAARVTPDGAVLDPSGVAVSTARGDQDSPSVGWDGTNTLIAWGDHRSGRSFDIVGARLRPDGHVVDVRGAIISRRSTDEFDPTVAEAGDRVLVAYLRLALEPPYLGVDRPFFRFFSEG